MAGWVTQEGFMLLTVLEARSKKLYGSVDKPLPNHHRLNHVIMFDLKTDV